MFDWIFSFFRFTGTDKKATTETNLTKKADIAEEDIHSQDSLEAAQKAISGIIKARDAQRHACDEAGLLVTPQMLADKRNAGIEPQLRAIYNAGVKRSSFAPAIIAELTNDSSVSAIISGQSGTNGPIYQLTKAHVDESAIYDAIEAYVYNFLKNFDITREQNRSLLNTLSGYISNVETKSVGESVVLPEYAIKQLRKFPDYADMSDAELNDMYNDAREAINERKRIKNDNEKKSPADWSPLVNRLYRRVQSILLEHPIANPDPEDPNTIYNQLAAPLSKMCAAAIKSIPADKSPITNAIRTLYKVPTETESTKDRDDQQEDKDTPIDVADTKQDVNISNPEHIYKMRDVVFNALMRYAGQDKSRQAIVKAMQNSVRDSIDMQIKGEGVRGSLKEYAAQLKQLAKAGTPVFTDKDVRNAFKQAYQQVNIKDPLQKDKLITLERLKADVQGITAAINLLKLSDKKGRGYNDALTNLREWTTIAHPDFKEREAKKKAIYAEVQSDRRKLKELEKQKADLQKAKHEVPVEMQNTIDQLNKQIPEKLEQYHQMAEAVSNISSGLRLKPVEHVLEQLGIQHGGVGAINTTNTKDLIKNLANLKAKYKYRLQEAGAKANKEAQQKVANAFLTSQRNVLANLERVKDATSGQPLITVPGFKAALNVHYTDVVRKLVAERNVNALEEFLKESIENPVKDRPTGTAKKLTNNQLDSILKSQNDADMADYLTWFIQRHTKDNSFINNKTARQAMAASMDGATPERISAALDKLFQEPALANSLIAMGTDSEGVDYSNFVKQLISDTSSDVNTYKKETHKDVALAPLFEAKGATSFLENAVEEGIMHVADEYYSEMDSLIKRLDDTYHKYSRQLDAAEEQYSNPTATEEEKQAALERIKAISTLLSDEEMYRMFVGDINSIKHQAEYDRDNEIRYKDAKETIDKATYRLQQIYHLQELAENFAANPGAKDNGLDSGKEKPFTRKLKDLVDDTPSAAKEEKGGFIDAFPDLKLYFDGDRYFYTEWFNGEYHQTTTTFKGVVIPADKAQVFAVPSVKDKEKEVVTDGQRWYNIDEETGLPSLEIVKPIHMEPINAEQPKQAPATEPEEQKEPEQAPEQEQEPEQDGFTYNKEEISDEEPFTTSTGFKFKGVNRTAGFSFKGTPQMIFKFAKSTDGIDAFTSPEEVQKTIEQPFGTAMTPAEMAIKKQRAISPDNTSQMGQTSIQQDQEANKPFSSKQITKALKAAYDKDPNLFNELVNIIANTGSTGTFCSAIVALLPKVNWVNEAAIREYNKTAQDPVHRNSFQQALEKAMEEQLKKHPEFVKICGSILKGQPVK